MNRSRMRSQIQDFPHQKPRESRVWIGKVGKVRKLHYASHRPNGNDSVQTAVRFAGTGTPLYGVNKGTEKVTGVAEVAKTH